MIRRVYTNDLWRDYLSEKRLEKAQTLLQERCRRNQDLTLLDCLQFSDKGQIVARSEKLRAMTRFESRREVERDVKLLEALRNSLAHAQDIITSDWDAIILLTKDIDRVLTGPG